MEKYTKKLDNVDHLISQMREIIQMTKDDYITELKFYQLMNLKMEAIYSNFSEMSEDIEIRLAEYTDLSTYEE